MTDRDFEKSRLTGMARAKWDAFEPYLADSTSILHIGASSPQGGENVNWLHAHLDEEAETVVGIEIDDSKVQTARQLGYRVEQASAETFSLDETFDLIIAPDVIEHLRNPGLMFDQVAEHLEEDGHFLVNTPNPMTLIYMLGYLKRGSTEDISPRTTRCGSTKRRSGSWLTGPGSP